MTAPARAALSPARRLLPYLPPLALAVVAGAQFALAHRTPLSPWKLGGFGMFSTQDQPRSRTLRLHLLTDEGTFVVMDDRGPESLRAWPRRVTLRKVAREAACGAWRTVPLDSVGTVAAPSPAWDWVYRSRTLRQRSALAGVAVPAVADGRVAPIRAARAVVVTAKLDAGADSSVVALREVAAETVRYRDAGCSAS